MQATTSLAKRFDEHMVRIVCMQYGQAVLAAADLARHSIVCRNWRRPNYSMGSVQEQSDPTSCKGLLIVVCSCQACNGLQQHKHFSSDSITYASSCALHILCTVVQNGKAQTWQQYRKATEKDREQLRYPFPHSFVQLTLVLIAWLQLLEEPPKLPAATEKDQFASVAGGHSHAAELNTPLCLSGNSLLSVWR